MSVNTRNILIDALKTRFEGIRVGETIVVDGDDYIYQTSIGDGVKLRRLVAHKLDNLPLLNMHPGPVRNDTARSEIGRPMRVLPVVLNLVFADKGDEYANEAILDIHKTIGIDHRWSALRPQLPDDVSIVETAIDIGEPDYNQEDRRVCTIPMLVEIRYRTSRWDI